MCHATYKAFYKKIPPIEMQHVKVIDLCWAFYCCIESPVIGIVFHCKHNLIHSYIQSLNPKILKFNYLQIWHKACLVPFLVTNWPQRHNLFHENPLTYTTPEISREIEGAVQIPHPWHTGIKFPTPWKTLIIKFPPLQDGKGVKCPGYAPGGDVEASIWPIH